VVYVGIDSHLASDWARLEELASLLETFAAQTDILQRDAQALSSIIPSILDLECHLQQHSAPKTLTLQDLRRRFETLMQPNSPDFNPLPAAACLLDPSLATALMEPDQASLLYAAKKYIIQQCKSQPSSAEPVTSEGQSVGQQCAPSAGLSRFRFLASKMQTSERTAASSTQSPDAAVSQLTRYTTEAVEAGPVADFISGRVGKPVIAVSSHLQRTSCLLQHLKLMLSAFFLCVACSLLVDATEQASHWKCAYF